MLYGLFQACYRKPLTHVIHCKCPLPFSCTHHHQGERKYVGVWVPNWKLPGQLSCEKHFPKSAKAKKLESSQAPDWEEGKGRVSNWETQNQKEMEWEEGLKAKVQRPWSRVPASCMGIHWGWAEHLKILYRANHRPNHVCSQSGAGWEGWHGVDRSPGKLMVQ